MKMTHKLATAAMAALVLGLTSVSAEDAVTTTTTQTYSGTIASLNAGDSTIMVSGDAGASPVAYSYTEKTTFVDPQGNVISYDTITPETPVELHYSMDGDMRTVDRVVVQQPVAAQTTTTTTTVEEDD